MEKETLMENRAKVKKVFAAAVVAVCLSLGAAGTLAYFTDEETAHNVVTSGGVDIEIVEKTLLNNEEYDFPEGGIEGVMPGAEVSKIVSVKNVGPAEAWVRVKVDRGLLKKGTAEKMPLAIESAGGDAADGAGKVDLLSFEVKEGWIDGGDGWFYWSEPVAPGESTGVLFDKVLFAKLMPNAYQGCTARVDVLAQAVQTANNPASASGVTSVQGWPAVEGAE